MKKTNLRLDNLIQTWRDLGSPDQEAFPWSRSKENWQKLADDFSVDISSFPALIDRNFIWKLNRNGAAPETVFLAVMVWGYGDIGYGPHRVRQMFQSPNFFISLAKVRDLCRNRRLEEAYSALKSAKIRQLGPSFGTKVLTFFHDPKDAPAILDSVVGKWCNRNVHFAQVPSGLIIETWNLNSYLHYQRWISEMSDAHEVSVCSIEQIIFEDEYSQ
jgi:hypothetical protein